MKVAKTLQNSAGFKYDTACPKIGETRVNDDRDHKGSPPSLVYPPKLIISLNSLKSYFIRL